MTWRSVPLVLLLITAAAAHADPAVDTSFRWEALPDLPMGVIVPAASVSGHYLVVSGGITLTGGATDLVQIMDLDTYTWVRTERLAQPRFNHAQVTLNDGRVLVVGGEMHDASIGRVPRLSECELIDLNGGVTPVPPLPERMPSPTAHLLDDGRVVVVGWKTACVYDPVQNTWGPPIALHQPRNQHASVLLDQRRVLVVAGTGMRTFECIDLTSGDVSYAVDPSLPVNLDDLKAALLPDGRVWVIGGQLLGGVTIDRTWLATLDHTGAVVSVAEGPSLGLPAGISDHMLIATRWGLVAAGGESENAERHDTELRTSVLLDPRNLSVTHLPDTKVAHDDAAAVAWDGTIILLGGQTPGEVLGLTVPTPVRAVEMLVRDEGSGIGVQGSGTAP